MDKEQLRQNGFKEIKLISAKEHKTILFTDYMINREGQIWSFKTDKILDGSFSCNGYKMYSLYTIENGKNKRITVYGHVLITSTFFEEVKINNIDDENSFEVVHHIDHDKNNNSISNLLWISKVEHLQLHSKSDITRKKKSENSKGEKNGMYGKHHTEEVKRRLSESKKGESHPKSKPVIAFTDSANYYQEFACAREAGRELGVDNSSIIKCCNGKLKSAGKYKDEKLRWKYKEKH